VVLQYFVMVVLTVYQIFVIFISDLYILIIVGLVINLIKRFMSKDNELAQGRLLEGARLNGYFE